LSDGTGEEVFNGFAGIADREGRTVVIDCVIVGEADGLLLLQDDRMVRKMRKR
jgi:hypothetical protein